MDLEDLFDDGRRGGRRGRYDDDDDDGRADRRYRAPDDDDGREDRRYRRRDDDPHDRDLSDRGRARRDDGDRHRDDHDDDDDDDWFDLSRIVDRLRANKRLMVLAGVVLVVVLVLATIFVLPRLGKAVDSVDKTGLNGTVDRVLQSERDDD